MVGVQALGTGVQVGLEEIVQFVLVAFWIVVLLTGFTTSDWNIFGHAYNILNGVFFSSSISMTGAKACVESFNSFAGSDPNDHGIIGILADFADFLFDIVGFIVRFVIGCGITILTYGVGALIILSSLFYFFRFIGAIKTAGLHN